MCEVEKPDGYEGRKSVKGTIKKINEEVVNSRHKPWTPVTIQNAFVVFENGTTGYGQIPYLRGFMVGDVITFTANFTKSKTSKSSSFFKYGDRFRIVENEYYREEEFQDPNKVSRIYKKSDQQ